MTTTRSYRIVDEETLKDEDGYVPLNLHLIWDHNEGLNAHPRLACVEVTMIHPDTKERKQVQIT